METNSKALFDPYLMALGNHQDFIIHPADPEEADAPQGSTIGGVSANLPWNISPTDFHHLQNRLLYSALAFSQQDDSLKNNTSVVLLLEWQGNRLLFTGDAEWKGTNPEDCNRNSAWDVMLHIPEVRQVLLQPLDFLKVAHHGSHNGTPFHKGGKENVLTKLLSPDKTKVAVSTVFGEHGVQNPVPYPALMEELGKLAVNKRRYNQDKDESLRNVDQPQRTDLEPAVPGEGVHYVEVVIEPSRS